MANRLADQTSPYLRQHAANPVDWQPWDEQALQQAREQDKPILLSIGYSACHWCHVMAHECFENDSVAALMNAHYVNIKVDREQRPDLDKVYQLAYQVMMQRGGGWPLTMLLDPHSHAPFMAGTYFPLHKGRGMPAFPDVLQQAAQWYAQNKHQLNDQKQQLDAVFARLEDNRATNASSLDTIRNACKQLSAHFDSDYGGFGNAPKFPQPGNLVLLGQLADHGNAAAGDMLDATLHSLCAGGLFDHLGGGFFRYCVDDQWQIPHFEKMLYDNAALLSLTSRQAWHTEDALMGHAAHCTADWLLEEMRSTEDGFFSSLDADSKAGEGAYYVWTREQAQAALVDRYTAFAAAYGLDKPANFEARWHLQLGAQTTVSQQQLEQLAAGRQALLSQRMQRPAPARDDKILTAWNALTISALAAAHQHLGRSDCLDAATGALTFIRATLWRDNRLLSCCKDGQAHLPAYLDDYAFLLHALLDMLEQCWNSDWLDWAMALADGLLAHFENVESGGFYFTAHDHEILLHRPRPLVDESTPSGNGVTVRALLRLGWLVCEPRYLDAADRTLAYAAHAMQNHPMAHATLLSGLQDSLQPPECVIVRGAAQTLPEWQQAARTVAPRHVFAIPVTEDNLPPALADKAAGEQPVAYICKGTTCSAPVTDKTELEVRPQA